MVFVSDAQRIAQRIANGTITQMDRITDAQSILALERDLKQAEKEVAVLRSGMAEAIRRLKLAMRAAGPRRGLGYKDLQAVLDAPATAPRSWEQRDAAKT